jgi:filamentous hemagglutinin family protein
VTLRNYQPVAWVLYQRVIDQSKADIFIKSGIINYAYVLKNEVGSTNRSVLKGALEVFGKNAAVVIANPNGFDCELGFAMLIKSTPFAVASIYVVGLLVASTT